MNYYTANEAMQILHKPRSTFFKEVEEGLIPSELEPGRQRGRRYPKEAIDTLAQQEGIDAAYQSATVLKKTRDEVLQERLDRLEEKLDKIMRYFHIE